MDTICSVRILSFHFTFFRHTFVRNKREFRHPSQGIVISANAAKIFTPLRRIRLKLREYTNQRVSQGINRARKSGDLVHGQRSSDFGRNERKGVLQYLGFEAVANNVNKNTLSRERVVSTTTREVWMRPRLSRQVDGYRFRGDPFHIHGMYFIIQANRASSGYT